MLPGRVGCYIIAMKAIQNNGLGKSKWCTLILYPDIFSDVINIYVLVNFVIGVVKQVVHSCLFGFI